MMKIGVISAVKVLSAVIMLVCCYALPTDVRAADWEITADETHGLVSNPKYPYDGSNLFDVNNMTPGDKEKSTVTVKNNCSFSFLLKVEVKNLGVIPEDGVDLAKQLTITAYRDGNLLDDFPSAPTKVGVYTFENAFAPDALSDIEFRMELPGESTGNEFQDRKARLKWIFTADAVPSPSPGPGGSDPVNPGSGSGTGTGGQTDEETGLYELDNSELPLGTAEIGGDEGLLGDPLRNTDDGGDEPQTDEVVIGEDDIPLASFEMPKTGEAPLWRSVMPGFALVLLGAALIIKDKLPGRNIY